MGREFVTRQCMLSTYGEEQMLQGRQVFPQRDCAKPRASMCPPCPDSASCAFAGVKAVCNEYKIHNADITMREDCDIDDLVDVIEGSRVYIPCIYAVNKIVRSLSNAAVMCHLAAVLPPTGSVRLRWKEERYTVVALPALHWATSGASARCRRTRSLWRS
jgi:C-terminal region of MMR_HSR1 domain